MDECTERGCGRSARGRGLCGTHYAFHRRHGTLPPLPERASGCGVEDCARRHEAHGLCKLHYDRLRKSGTVETPLVRGPDDERFWAKVDRDGSCWLWRGGISKRTGYGHIWWEGTTKLAHRVAYTLLVGPIPDGLTIDHLRELCGNRHCVKAAADGSGPAHLEVVTQRVNNLRADGYSGTNHRKTHCVNGHELTPENVYTPPKQPRSRNCRQCIKDANRRASERRRDSRLRVEQPQQVPGMF